MRFLASLPFIVPMNPCLSLEPDAGAVLILNLFLFLPQLHASLHFLHTPPIKKWHWHLRSISPHDGYIIPIYIKISFWWGLQYSSASYTPQYWQTFPFILKNVQSLIGLVLDFLLFLFSSPSTLESLTKALPKIPPSSIFLPMTLLLY